MSDLGINMSDFSNTENLPNSLKELKEKCLDYSHKISRDEVTFFNLTDAAQIKSYRFCNGTNFPPETNPQYVRGYIEGIRCTLGSCLCHISAVQYNMDSLSDFSRWHPVMKEIVTKKQCRSGLSDYESGEIIGQLEVLEYIRQRYRFAS